LASFRLEKELARGGARRIAGILPADWLVRRPPAWVSDIDDSKIVAAPRRSELAAALLREASGVGVGLASSTEIDALNIYQASRLAMVRAIESLPEPPDVLLVDGFPIKELNYRQMGVPRGDRLSRSIAAASIVAKVFRDGLMATFDALYEGYGLARNKGYGTEEHLRALKDKGPTGLHRASFKLG
jgi:ribonuclease HII